MNLIEELRWRGMLQDIIPGTEEYLLKNKVVGYVGFDPTADSLHIGSLVPILLLVHLQKAGHTPIALVGGATGMVGDPSGKSAERNLLDEATLTHNLNGIKAQLAKFIDFHSNASNAAKMVNNYDWFKNYNFLDFIREIGKSITVNYMMSKDSVKKRLEGDSGMSFTEFCYQLIQGYDFLALYQKENCVLQMGGSDQWGNIITGTELIRKKLGKEAFALTCPLITKADGGKFGKSEKGNIWLDATKTSPFEFYQFWLRCEDTDAEKWIKIFTFLTKETIATIIENHTQQKEKRILQKRLAEELTRFVHGEEALTIAIQTTEKLYNNNTSSLESLSPKDLEALEGITKIEVLNTDFNNVDFVSFLETHKIFSSKSEAKKMINNGGVSINRNRIDTTTLVLNTKMLLHDKYVVIQKGKKSYFLIIIK